MTTLPQAKTHAPQESLAAPRSTPEAPRFYKLDMRRVTYAEWFAETHNPIILLVAACVKYCGFRPPSSADDLTVDSLAPFEHPLAEIADAVLDRFAPVIPQMAALGFESQLYHHLIDPVQSTTTHLISYLHKSGKVAARSHLRLWSATTPPREYLTTEYFTQFNDGSFLWSINNKPDLASPPESYINRVRKATPEKLLESHQQALQQLIAQGKIIRPIRTPDDLRSMLERQQARLCEFHVQRGVYRLPDSKETAHKPVIAATGEISGDDEILAEIARMQQKHANWITGIVLLIVSLLAFVAISSKDNNSLQELYILVGVLAFHELGHYLAMRVFGYRNVRMFFIPFLGAAVSGQHYNVAGWKKVLVAMMGPLPGIVLAIPLGAAGLWYGKPILTNIAVLSLILNGFNLLPVLPLDGGHIMHSLLFSRHHILDLVFRILALCAMLLLAISTGSAAIIGLVVGGAITLPVTYRLSRITTELRQSGFLPVSQDSCTIAPYSARTIIAKIRSSYTKPVANKVLAQQTLSIFETLNARPPGVLMSLLLGAVHACAILAAIISVAVFVVLPRFNDIAGGLMGIDKGRPIAPETVMTQTVDSVSATITPDTHTTLVADFDDKTKATQAFAGLAFESLKPTQVTLFGQTLLVTFPVDNKDAIKKATDYLKSQSGKIGTARASTALAFKAGDSESMKKAQKELTTFFELSRYGILAPWDPAYSANPEQKAKWQHARETMEKITRAESEVYSQKGYQSIMIKMMKARGDGDDAKASDLQAKMNAMVREHRDKIVQQLKAEPEEQVDHALLADYEKSPLGTTSLTDNTKDPTLRDKAMRSLAPHFGALPRSANGTLAPEAFQYHAQHGYQWDNKDVIWLMGINFSNMHTGPLAALKWLQSQGATDLQYKINASAMDDEEYAEEE